MSHARWAAACVVLTAIGMTALASAPLGTAFTYQGRLKSGSSAVNGTADLQVSLWDDPNAGTQIGTILPLNNVAVTAGLFTVSLDFGATAFDGNARWLQIAVRVPAGSGSFTTLTPRQPLTATPYALGLPGLAADGNQNLGLASGHFLSFHPGDTFSYDSHTMGNNALGWFPDSWNSVGATAWLSGYAGIKFFTGGDVGAALNKAGRLGVGTTTPQASLDVNGGILARGGAPGPSGVNNNGYAFSSPGDNDSGMFSSASGQVEFYSNNSERMRITGNGNVGIGTTTPNATLQVNGSTTLGQAVVSSDGRIQERTQYNNVQLLTHGEEFFQYVAEHANGSSLLEVRTDGNTNVLGTLNVSGTKNFVIDDPLDPANKTLAHNAVEGPGYYTYYHGNVVLDGDGSAWVALPSYFEALNTDVSYNLTCVGAYAPVYVAQEVQDNRFQIAGGHPGLKVCWQISATRRDPYALDHPYQAEIEKAATARGHFYYPAGYNQPDELNIARTGKVVTASGAANPSASTAQP